MGSLYSKCIELSLDNLEKFSLLWLDASINTSEDNIQTQKTLRETFSQLQTFEKPGDCVHYIRKASKDDRIVLIVGGQLGRDIVPHIDTFQQLVSIYVYCHDQKRNEQWANNHSKVKAVVTDLNELIVRIQVDHEKQQQSRIHEPLLISIFYPNMIHEKLTIDLQGNLVQTQLLINCLLRGTTKEDDRKQLISISKQIYKNNKHELDAIRDFEENYDRGFVIQWYTREIFLSRLLNKALRTQNIDILFLFHFFIMDIQRQLQKLQHGLCRKVYRGQFMSKDELKNVQNAVGQFISINSFLSAFLDRSQALSYLDNSDGLEQVLFEIDADSQVTSDKPFANIKPYSMTKQDEIIFMLGSIFEMVGVKREKDRIWVVQLKLYSDNNEQLDSILGKEKRFSFGHVLMTIGKVEEAEMYYRHLLDQLPEPTPDRARCCEALGSVANEKGEYDASLRLYEEVLEINKKTLDKRHRDIASNYNSIGEVYRKRGNHEKALEYYNKALAILNEKSTGKELAKRAVCLNNIGIVHQEQQKYKEAFELYTQAFEIRKKYFPSDEISLGMSYNNIGSAHYVLRLYEDAMFYYKEALKLYKKALPPDHPKVASTYNNIGAIYDDQGKPNDALTYYENALQIYRSIFYKAHPNIAKIKENIKRIRDKLKK